MPDQHTLDETERAMKEAVAGLPLDYAAANAISSLYRAAHAARQHLTNGVLRPNDLTWTGFLVLWLLWIWGSMETRRVAENVGIAKATLTGVTHTLVARGLVERVPSSGDRRLVSLALTPLGQGLMVDLYPQFNIAEAELVAAIAPKRLEVLTHGLRQIVTTVEEEGKAAHTGVG